VQHATNSKVSRFWMCEDPDVYLTIESGRETRAMAVRLLEVANEQRDSHDALAVECKECIV
jgi:hypothetical protein